jgi:hypothetical protein
MIKVCGTMAKGYMFPMELEAFAMNIKNFEDNSHREFYDFFFFFFWENVKKIEMVYG